MIPYSEWLPIKTAPKDGTEILISDLDCIDIVHWEREPMAGVSYWLNRDGEVLFPYAWQLLPDHPEPPSAEPLVLASGLSFPSSTS